MIERVRCMACKKGEVVLSETGTTMIVEQRGTAIIISLERHGDCPECGFTTTMTFYRAVNVE